MKKLFLTAAASLLGLSCLAQFREPVDTIMAPDSSARIIIMSDKTWEYESDCIESDTLTVDWVEQAVMPFQVPLNQLPDTIVLNLRDSMGLFCCPFIGVPSSRYGYRHRRRHQGIDIPFHTGTPIFAAFDGIVTRSGYIGGYGNLIVVRHYNGMETYYGHLSRRDVVAGDWVTAGQIIGLGGSTGHSTGPHIHFETRYKGYPFDPERLIEFTTGKLRSDTFVLAKSYFAADSRFGIDDRKKIDSLIVASKPKVEYHTVRSGETLSSIARKHRTTVGQICKLNKISAKKLLKPGQKLRVK
mgnify:CR=1 FL=1